MGTEQQYAQPAGPANINDSQEADGQAGGGETDSRSQTRWGTLPDLPANWTDRVRALSYNTMVHIPKACRIDMIVIATAA